MTHAIALFEKTVTAHPDAIAIKMRDGELTYSELDKRINQLANHLQQNFATTKKPYRIAILQERALDTLIMMYAAWKIGASYLLLDPNDLNKEGAISNLLTRCYIDLLAITLQYKDHQQTVGLPHFYFDAAATQAAIGGTAESFNFQVTTDNEAYLILTSGTTGEPKIVVINHTQAQGSGLAALFEDLAEQMKIAPGDVALWDCPVKFDPIIAVPGWAFAGGGAIYIAEPGESYDDANIKLLVPSLAKELLKDKAKLQKIKRLRLLFTGEELTPELARAFAIVADGGIFNGFGPTEGPVGITFTKVIIGDEIVIDIGRAIKGRDYKIVYPNSNTEVKPGEQGELVYKSEGFAGYLDNPAATAARKISINGETYWRSGDLVRQAEHVLKFIGRVDSQVKILGVRIEPKSIAACLQQQLGVEFVFTTVQKPTKPGELPRIISFCKTKAEAEVTTAALAKALRAKVRVLNHSIIILDPDDALNYVTANGKFDSKALLARYQEKINPVTAKKQSIIERLRNYWQFILSTEDIADEDDFYDLGGDSFAFAQLKFILAEDEVLKIKQVTSQLIAEFVKKPTLAELARQIKAYQAREKLISYYHQQRLGKALIVLSNITQEAIDDLAITQPLVQIQYEEILAEKATDLVRTVKLYDPVGPYYLATSTSDFSLLNTVAQQLGAEGGCVAFAGCLDAPHFVDKLNVAHEYHLRQAVQAKINIIKDHEPEIAEKPSKDIATCYAVLQEHQFVVAFAEKFYETKILAQAVADKFSVSPLLPVLLDGAKVNIQTCLLQLGFEQAEFALLAQKELCFIVDNVRRPAEVKVILAQAASLGFSSTKFLWLCDPGLYAETAYVKNLPSPAIVRLSSPEVITVAAPLATDIVQCMRAAIDKTLPQASMQEKAALFHAIFHYSISLAHHMGEADNITHHFEMAPENIWLNEQPYQAATTRLFDSLDQLTVQAFNASLVVRRKNKITFVTPEIKKYFQQFNPNAANWPNPYTVLEEPVLKNNLRETIKQVAKIYHAQGSQAPLFLLPPITGEESFENLAVLCAKTRPLISLRHPVWADADAGLPTSFASLQALAQFYVPIITAMAAGKPVSLCGWSFGGLLVAEITRQLRLQGISVDFAGIIDTPAPAYMKFLFANIKAHRSLLLARARWLIHAYDLPEAVSLLHSLADSDLQTIEKVDAFWLKVLTHIESHRAKIKKFTHVRKVIGICCEHHRFSLEYQFEDENISAFHLYQATQSDPDGFYELITMPNLGWPFAEKSITKVEGEHHFSVTGSKAFADKLQSDLATVKSETGSSLASEKIKSHLNAVLNSQEAIEGYVPLKYAGRDTAGNATTQTIDDLWSAITNEKDPHSYVLLGEAGSGKSLCARRLFQQLAKQYLNHPNAEQIPFYLKLSDYAKDPLQSFIKNLALSQSQLYYLQQRQLIFIIDGIDEVGAESLQNALAKLPFPRENVRFVYTCKTAYYQTHPSLKNTLNFYGKAKAITLLSLQPDQQRQLIALYTDNSHALENQLMRMAGSDAVINPLQLTLLLSMLNFPAVLPSKILLHTRAALYQNKLLQLSQQYEISPVALFNFAKQLAIKLYLDKDEIIRKKLLPWESQIVTFERHLQYQREDTTAISTALSLQHTAAGLAFNHHSYQEFFMALALWSELMQAEALSDTCLLNSLELCYEQDLLNFIADLYQAYVFAEPEVTKQRRQQRQTRLHQLVFSAKKTPDRKILAANALSILAACRDVFLKFPANYQEIHLAAVNLSGATLDNIDFSGVFAAEAILDAASLEKTCIPRNWKPNHKAVRHRQYLSLSLHNGDLLALQLKRDHVGNFSDFSLVNLSQRDALVAQLELAGIPETGRNLAHSAESVAYLKDAEVYALASKYPLGTVMNYKDETSAGVKLSEEKKPYQLQVFEKGQLKHTYYHGFRDLSSEIVRFMVFHPEAKRLFALSKDSHRLYVFEGNNEKQQLICRTNPNTEHFVINKASGQLCISERRPELCLHLIGIEPPFNLQKIFIKDLIAAEIYEYASIKDIASFENKPWIVFSLDNESFNAAYIFDIQQKKIIHTLHLGGARVKKLCINQNGEKIAIAFYKDIYIWQPLRQSFIPVFKSHQRPDDVKQMIFATDDKLMLLRSVDLITVYLPRAETPSHLAKAHQQLSLLIKHPTEPWVYSFGDEHVFVWHLQTGERLYSLELDGTERTTGCLSKEGELLFIAQGFSIYVYDVITRQRIKKITVAQLKAYDDILINKLIFEPGSDTQLIFATLNSVNKQLYRYNWQTDEVAHFCPGEFDKSINLHSSSAHGNVIAFGKAFLNTTKNDDPDETIYIYSEGDNKPYPFAIKFTTSYVPDIAFANHKTEFIALGISQLGIFQPKQETIYYDYNDYFKEGVWCNHVSYSPDDRYVVTSQRHDSSSHPLSGSIAFWDFAVEAPLLHIIPGNNVNISRICWVSSEILMIGRINGELYWYDVTKIKEARMLHTTANYQMQDTKFCEAPVVAGALSLRGAQRLVSNSAYAPRLVRGVQAI